MSNKVYIVTSGSYSDYNIQRCFLNKEKAEAYMKVCSDSDLNDLEEYDLDDNIEFNPANYVIIQYYFKDIPSYAKNPYNFRIIKSNNIETNLNSQKRNYIYGNYFNIFRPIYSIEYDENYLKEKYKKICEDISAKIESLYKIEEWNKEMIKDWFENKQDYIPKSE